jgi:ankyrin repeat protein
MLALPHADANVKNAAGTTPLHWAAAAGDAATVQQLLAAGADPNVASARGDRPLHWAVEWLNVPTLRTLLATRSPHAATASAHAPAAAAASAASAASVADVSAVDEQGDTPLHRVSANCHHEWRCARIVALLIRSGAEMSRPNKHGRTPQQHFDLTVAPPQSDRELDDLALDDGPTEITVNNAATSGEHIGDFPVVDGAAAAAAAAVAEPAEQDESDDSALLDSAARRSKKLGKVPPA